MSPAEIRQLTQSLLDRFYSLSRILAALALRRSLRDRLAFVLVSKLYRQMFADTGIATDAARVRRAGRWSRMLVKPCPRLFAARPMPALQIPQAQ